MCGLTRTVSKQLVGICSPVISFVPGVSLKASVRRFPVARSRGQEGISVAVICKLTQCFYCCRCHPDSVAHAAQGQLPGRSLPAGQVAASSESGSCGMGGYLHSKSQLASSGSIAHIRAVLQMLQSGCSDLLSPIQNASSCALAHLDVQADLRNPMRSGFVWVRAMVCKFSLQSEINCCDPDTAMNERKVIDQRRPTQQTR